MKLFLDTANLGEVKRAVELGVICGVTTNPSLVAKENRDFWELLRELAAMVPGPVSAEVLAVESEAMVREAEELAALAENVVVKIPLTAEGLKAVGALEKRGVRTNVTLVFSAQQGLLAARAGATYVSPFVGRMDDTGHEGMQVVRDLAQIFRLHELKAEVIAASIRHPLHVLEAAKAGAHVATVPFNVLEQMIRHPLTDIGIRRFLDDWKAVRANK